MERKLDSFHAERQRTVTFGHYSCGLSSNKWARGRKHNTLWFINSQNNGQMSYIVSVQLADLLSQWLHYNSEEQNIANCSWSLPDFALLSTRLQTTGRRNRHVCHAATSSSDFVPSPTQENRPSVYQLSAYACSLVLNSSGQNKNKKPTEQKNPKQPPNHWTPKSTHTHPAQLPKQNSSKISQKSTWNYPSPSLCIFLCFLTGNKILKLRVLPLLL